MTELGLKSRVSKKSQTIKNGDRVFMNLNPKSMGKGQLLKLVF